MVRTRLGIRYRHRRIARRFFFVRPEIKIELYRTNYGGWDMFKDHHYLDDKINKGDYKAINLIWKDFARQSKQKINEQ